MGWIWALARKLFIIEFCIYDTFYSLLSTFKRIRSYQFLFDSPSFFWTSNVYLIFWLDKVPSSAVSYVVSVSSMRITCSYYLFLYSLIFSSMAWTPKSCLMASFLIWFALVHPLALLRNLISAVWIFLASCDHTTQVSHPYNNGTGYNFVQSSALVA